MRCSTIGMVCMVCLALAASAFAQGQVDTVFVRAESANIRLSPEGQELGTVTKNVPLRVVDRQGNWVKVQIEGWIWRASTTGNPNMISTSEIEVEKGFALLDLTDFEIGTLPADDRSGRTQPQAVLTLMLANNSSEDIRAWRGMLIVSNKFGDKLLYTRLTDPSTQLAVGDTTAASFSWPDNPEVTDDIYDILTVFSKEGLILDLEQVEISH